MSKKGSNKIINFMNPRAGVLVLGRGHIVKMHYLLLYPYTVNVSKDYYSAFYNYAILIVTYSKMELLICKYISTSDKNSVYSL